MASTIVGLDIGDGVLRAAEIADAGKARPTLVRYHSVDLPAGAVHRGEVLEPGTFTSALKQLWATGGFKSKKVVLGVGNHRVLVRDMSLPKVPLPQIKESLPFQVQEMLPVPVADALLDFFPISSSVTEQGEMINGLLVAAIKDSVLANLDAVEAAGLEPIEVDLVPFALTRSLLAAGTGGTAAVLHVGARTSIIVIAHDGVPQFVRLMQIGGEDVTDALVSSLGVERGQADQIKRGLGLTPENVTADWRPAVDAIQRATGELLDSLRNTLLFYANTRQGASVERLVVSGGGAQLAGFAEVVAEMTRLPVDRPDPLQFMSVGKGVDAGAHAAPGIAVAAGLAMGSKA